MEHFHYDKVGAEKVELEGAVDVSMRVLIDEKTGAPNFKMRMFELEPGGQTPWHSHDFEHEVFVLEGEGAVVTEKGEQVLKPWDVVFMPGNEQHNFKNTGKGILRFLCLVPK